MTQSSVLASSARPLKQKDTQMSSVYDFTADTIDGKSTSLDAYKGKTMLIVNVASECGFTPQYKGLEALYEKYKDRGLEVFGFPCNQFGAQEPGTADEIVSFCELNYGVTFPLFAKIDVNGERAAPVYDYLQSAKPGLLGTEAIKWNFTKFLVGRGGEVIARFAPNDTPESIAADIEKAL